MISKGYKKIINYIKNNYKLLIIVGIILFVGLFRLPYNIYSGGGIIDIADKIEIEDEYREEGSFNMAYVRTIQATIPTYLLSYIFNWERESINSVKIDENDNEHDMWERELMYLEEANNNAIINAYTKAGENIKINKEILQILFVDKNSDTSLEAGDTIISIDGTIIRTFSDIDGVLSNHEVGDKLDIKYLRDGKEKDGYAVVRKMDDTKKIGIYLVQTYEYDVDKKIKLNFNNKEGGSSGGFMLSLAIYNRLVKEDLTKGRKIAGTGTIDRDGNVGMIGGIKYKVIGANSGKADIFFVPEQNYEEAIKFKEEKGYDLNIVKVKTLDDAIDYLRRN